MLKEKAKRTKFITTISILSAISVILFYIGGIPIFLTFPNLKVNLSDIPAVVGGMMISPWAGFLIELIKNLIHLFKTSTMGIGELMDLVVGGTFVISFSASFHLFNKKNLSKTRTYLGSYGISLILTILVALIANSIVYPLFLSTISKAPVTQGTMMYYLIAVCVINFIKVTITSIGGYIVMSFVNNAKR